VWRLDERRVPLEQSYLHLADYLRKKTLSSDRYNNLIRVIAARASEADGSLLRSIAWGIVDARDDTPERRALAEQVLDPRWGERVRSQTEAVKLAAIAERQRQAVSLFYSPVSAGLARSTPSLNLAEQVLGALAQRLDTAGLEEVVLPEMSASDPLGYIEGVLPIEKIRRLHLGHAYLLAGRAGCAVPALEAAEAATQGFPFPQLLAVAQARLAKEPCKAP
jgi:hypothetical protein